MWNDIASRHDKHMGQVPVCQGWAYPYCGVLTASNEGLNIATVVDMESNQPTSEEDEEE